MRKKNYKGRCEKRVLGKSTEVCRLYDEIQALYANRLQDCEEIKEIRCNVLLEGLEVGDYTSDFVCVKSDGDLMVRECVYRKFLTKPMTVKLLDLNRVDQETREQVETLVKQMVGKQGVTEQLKMQDLMKWVGLMNNIKACAEEIVLKESIYM